MIVIDASALLELVTRSPLHPQVVRLIGRPGESLHAPHLVDVEVSHVLRKLVHRNQLTDEEASRALSYHLDLDIERWEHEALLPRIWKHRDNLTAYDACYVALAEVLHAPLVTCDGALASSTGHEARIELVTRPRRR